MKYRLQTITNQDFESEEKLIHYLGYLVASENLPDKFYQKIKNEKYCESTVILGGVQTTTKIEIQEIPST